MRSFLIRLQKYLMINIPRRKQINVLNFFIGHSNPGEEPFEIDTFNWEYLQLPRNVFRWFNLCRSKNERFIVFISLLRFKIFFVILCRERDLAVQQCIPFSFVVTCIKYLSFCSATYFKNAFWKIPSIHQQQ